MDLRVCQLTENRGDTDFRDQEGLSLDWLGVLSVFPEVPML